jgi:phosphoglycolate phosphatase-like HAD superfamily hydrolase
MIFRKTNKAFCVNCLTAIAEAAEEVPVPGGGRYARRAACKGLPLALVTNKPTPFVAPLLDALDIAKYFTVVIGGDDVQKKAASGTAAAGGGKALSGACRAAVRRRFAQ